MNFAQRLSQGVRRHLNKLDELHEKQVKVIEDKARRQLAQAQTKTEREKVLLQLQREKMKSKQELYESQVATRKAKEALEKARKEAGYLTVGERLRQFGSELSRGGAALYKGLEKQSRRTSGPRRKAVRKTTQRTTTRPSTRTHTTTRQTTRKRA